MRPTEGDDGPQFKNSGEGCMPWSVFERFAKGMLQANWLDLEKVVAWNYGLSLTEVRLTRVALGWRLMLKATNDKGALVAFVTTDTYSAALELGAWESLAEMLTWRPDKYPSHS